LLLIAILPSADAAERPIKFECAGLESYEIRGTHDVDWAWGTIRQRHSPVLSGFSIGPVVEELVPIERPAGYRWFKVESERNVSFRYRYHVLQKQLRATIVGAPINRRLNLVAGPKDKASFLAVTRALITARCKGSFTEELNP
jgi:hypothetical protein